MNVKNTELEKALTMVGADAANCLWATATLLLTAAARGELDLNRMAREELANRGLNHQGIWVGFDEAAKLIG